MVGKGRTMTWIRTRCTVCNGRIAFVPDEQNPDWVGMLGFCWCGEAYRLAGGELVRLERPDVDRDVVDLRDSTRARSDQSR